MKKVLPLIAIVLIAGSIWYFTTQTSTQTATSSGPKGGEVKSTSPAASENSAVKPADGSAPQVAPDQIAAPATDDDGEGYEEEDVRPATEIYKSADEALQAVKDASKNYDDIVLEQFSEMSANCTWCDGFYSSLTQLMTSPDSTQDERSYYAEVLAISGRVDNVKTLVEAIKSAAKPEEADIYAEALELTYGKDDVTSYLSGQLPGANDSLRESLVAALTNQSSRLAADVLYKHTVERGNADGYYSEGIGLGEFIPDDEAIPYMQELVIKRDQYSHLAVKSLLNAGLDGLRVVAETLESSRDYDFDEKLLKDGVDHTSFDPEVEAYLKKIVETTKNPSLKKFAQESLDSISNDAGYDDEEEAEDTE